MDITPFLIVCPLVFLAGFIDEGGVSCQAPDNLQGKATEDGALIEWSFAQRDFQLDHFNVYRSATNSDYELVAEVTGNGPDYSYLDPVTEGAWYYRVTAVHADGTEICESEPAATPDGKVYVAIDMTFDLGDWLYYDNGYCATAVGRGDEMYWGVKFPKEMLADMQGKSLSRVAIYEGESCSGSYEMSFYLGGDNAPETIADVHSFELFGTDQWHFEDLPSPLPVSDDMNLWIVFHTTDVALSMPLLAPVAPRQILPPPLTTATSIPFFTNSFISLANLATTTGSIPKP